jgi:hypothetical protein
METWLLGSILFTPVHVTQSLCNLIVCSINIAQQGNIQSNPVQTADCTRGRLARFSLDEYCFVVPSVAKPLRKPCNLGLKKKKCDRASSSRGVHWEVEGRLGITKDWD